MPEAYGSAIRDWHRDEFDGPLRQRDGADIIEHPIERFYFGQRDPEGEYTRWLESWLSGPMIDLGAGAGRDALHFQQEFEVVALEVSEALVETMAERGVEDSRHGDMFSLREQFDRDRYRSALAIGTQICLSGSMQGLRSFLADLAYVTMPDATAVVHSFDPEADGVENLLGYRSDPARGLAHRVMWFEYGDTVDEALYFRLFSTDRLREAARASCWEVADVVRPDDEIEYRAALQKQ